MWKTKKKEKTETHANTKFLSIFCKLNTFTKKTERVQRVFKILLKYLQKKLRARIVYMSPLK